MSTQPELYSSLNASCDDILIQSFNNESKTSPHRNCPLITTNSFDLNTDTSTSDDSGLPLSNIPNDIDSYRISISKLELFESDGEVSLLESLEISPDGGMSVENFNTLKKGPVIPIDPPPEFQDSPRNTLIRLNNLEPFDNDIPNDAVVTCNISRCASQNLILVNNNKENALDRNDCCCNKTSYTTCTLCSHLYNIYDEPNDRKIIKTITSNTNNFHIDKDIKVHLDQQFSTFQKFNPLALSEIHDYDLYYGLKKNYNCDNYQQRKSLYSPLHHHNGGSLSSTNRPHSRNSLTSRLSSSHNSLTISNSNKPDDSIFITQAMSHDALLSREISDFYNVPVDSDIYASPIDMITPEKKYYCQRDVLKNKQYRVRYLRSNKRKKRGHLTDESEVEKAGTKVRTKRSEEKRNSVPENSLEPLHLTLEEVKQFYHTLYSNSNDINRNLNKKSYSNHKINESIKISVNADTTERSNQIIKSTPSQTTKRKTLANRKNLINGKTENEYNNNNKITINTEKKSQFSMSLNLKQKFCSIFRIGRNQRLKNFTDSTEYIASRSHDQIISSDSKEKIQFRALPPLPTKVISKSTDSTDDCIETAEKEKKKIELNSSLHFASSIEKVKDYGWYWGPLSSEAAEKVLSNEPDGSFIVRDSSDDHYIFSLSFKLNSCVRHVRIEQDQGTFSFGSYAKFKSQTITEFIEKAVEHSRSGRYLFFLHRRPEHGPMRVQLTNPVSRFKHVQSLQHMCRFVILKMVIRKDLVQSLPLPRRLLDYLSYKHCYSEQIESDSSQSQLSGDDAV